MKFILAIFVLLFVIIVVVNSGCKKDKAIPINTTCGCDATDIQFTAKNVPCTLMYHEYTKGWYLYYLDAGFYYIFFPCNKTQDSLKAILQGASLTSKFQVKLSGKVKSICQDEYLGYFVGSSAVYKIIIDSLKRN